MYKKNSIAAYKSVDKATMSGRDVEAEVLTKAAIKLKTCQDNWDIDAKERETALQQALDYNQRIWTIFQGELSSDDNPLPVEVRRDLIRLSAFIDKRTFEINAFPEKEKLNILIAINQNIAAGLRQTPATG